MNACKHIGYSLALFALFVACDSKGLRGARCRATTDCSNGLFCDSGTCKSCPAGLSVCGSLATSCSSTADCGVGKVCFQAQCFSSCGGDAECDLGLVCTDKRCVPGCRGDDACEATEICEQKSCKPGCRTDAACEPKQICESLSCVTGCRNDAACDPRQVCDNKVCNTGCRNDAACTVGAELCLSGQCVALDDAMKPSVTFTPSQAEAYVGENVVLSTIVSVTPGPNDTTPPVIAYENVNPAISVSGFNFTLNSTATAGSFAFTVKATGRGGTRTATFEFRVLTDVVHGYVVPVNPDPSSGAPTVPGIWRVQSDGNGFTLVDDEASDERMSRAAGFGFASRQGRSPAYAVGTNPVGSDGYARDYELRTSAETVWLRTTGVANQGTCDPGARAVSGALGLTGARTCMYPITNVTSDNTGRRVAFMIGKTDLDGANNPIADTMLKPGSVMVLDTTVASPSAPVILGDALNQSPTNAQSVIPGVTIFSRIPERQISAVGDVPATPRDQFSGPSISADGTSVAMTHRTLASCPADGVCGDNMACNNTPFSNGVCERTFCQSDGQCDGCESRNTCVNDAGCSGIPDLNGNASEGGRCETIGATKLCRSISLSCANDLECARGYGMRDANTAAEGTLCKATTTAPATTACLCAADVDCGQGRRCVAIPGSADRICVGPAPSVRVFGSQTYTCQGPHQGPGAGTGQTAGSCDGCKIRTMCSCRAKGAPPCDLLEQTIGAFCCSGGTSCAGNCELVAGTTSSFACRCQAHETANIDVSGNQSVPVCCSGGYCQGPSCESDTDCKANQTCNDNHCEPASASLRLEIYDTTQPLTPVASGPNLILTTPPSADVPPSFAPAVNPTLVQNDRMAFFSLPLFNLAGALSGTGKIPPRTRLLEVRLTTKALDPDVSTLLSPRDLGGVTDAGLLGLFFTKAPDAGAKLEECINTCSTSDNSACACPSGTTPACVAGTLGCCHAKCWDTCDSAASSAASPSGPFGASGPSGSEVSNFTAECQALLQSGATAVGSSIPMSTSRDDTGNRLLIVETVAVVGLTGFTGGTCTESGMSYRFCGAPAPSGGPPSGWDTWTPPAQTPPVAQTRLVLHDVPSDVSFDLLDTAAFKAFLNAQEPFEIGDPHMIAQGRQVAFVARGSAIKPPAGGGPASATDPSVFVVNADGSNPRRILDRTRAVAITVPGYGGIFDCNGGSCGSCDNASCAPASCNATPEMQLQAIAFQWFALFGVASIVRRVMRLARRRHPPAE